MENYEVILKAFRREIATHDDEFLLDVVESQLVPDFVKTMVLCELEERHPNRYHRWKQEGGFNVCKLRHFIVKSTTAF